MSEPVPVGTENILELNQALTVFGYEIDPVRSGRLPEFWVTLATLLPVTPRLRGSPDCIVTIPESCHPPRGVFSKSFSVFRKIGNW